MASVLRIPIPAPGIVVEDMDGELCLLSVDTDEVLILNQSASDIWILCTAGLDTEALINQLANAHGVAAIELSEQVTAAVAELESRGFLVEGHSDDA